MLINLERIIIILKLFKKAFWSQRLRVLVMAGLGFVGGLMGGIGIGAIVPLFSFVANDQNGASDNISRFIGKFFSLAHLDYTLTTLIILVICLFVIKAAFSYFANYISARITANYERTTRNELLKKTLSASWPYLLEQKIGHLETVLITDVTKSAGVLDLLSGTILVATNLLAYSIVALNISTVITLITLALGVVLFFILKPLLYKVRKLSRSWALNSKTVANQVAEYTIGAKAIKTGVVERYVLAKIQTFFNELREAKIKLAVYGNLQVSFQEPLSLILVVSIFAFSYARPDFQFASFLAVIYLVQKMFAFMQSIQGRLSGINESVPFLKAVTRYDDQATQHAEDVKMGTHDFRFNEHLEFNNVVFGYNEYKEVLSRINLRVKKGEMVGLIGPSGSGKTTVVDLILKLFEPSAGTILLDGRDISEINTTSWRKNIGYVSQDIFLLSDTIENNIRFYDPSISDQDIADAAKMANIYDVIQDQPDTFRTVVGERGVKFSVGQRQRIVLARVLARKPKILILDEATSALDNESEALIQRALENLKQKMTIIIIAHRLTTVMGCDKLVAIENGRIIERGTPDELLKNTDSYFYRTYNVGENR